MAFSDTVKPFFATTLGCWIGVKWLCAWFSCGCNHLEFYSVWKEKLWKNCYI